MEAYTDAVDFLFSCLPAYQNIGDAGMKKGLSGISKLLEAMGDPHKGLQCIHIAGTNGKGSTCHILSALLQEHDLNVGLYTSPHYLDYRERIKIGSAYIPETKIVEYVTRYKDLIAKEHFSFFEVSVAFAFLYFKEENVDVAIIEVGMGGRLDSTNVIDPLLTGITNIGLDHQSYLGETIEEIAVEKAGIMKKYVPVVIGKKQTETAEVFKTLAKQNKSPLVYADQMIDVQELDNGRFNCGIQGQQFETAFELKGDFQQENLKTALALYRIFCLEMDLELLAENGFENALSNIKERTNFQGRFEVIERNPLTILDSAHNVEGITELLSALNRYKFNHVHLVVGMVKDKDHQKIFSCFPRNAQWYLCAPEILRAADVNLLKSKADELELDSKSYQSVKEAFHAAQKNAKENDLILVTGSVFTVSEIMSEASLTAATV